MQRRHSIRMDLIGVIVVIALVSGIGIEAFSIYNTVKTNAQQQAEYRARLEEDIQSSLKWDVEVVMSLIEQCYQRYQDGEWTEEEAMENAKDIVRELRYSDGDGYFWIDTSAGVNVVLLGRDTEGTSRIDSVDQTGIYYIKEILNAGLQDGGGYAYYNFAKPDETEPLPKMSYSAYFEKWDWVVGTGVWIDYIDNLEAEYVATANAAMRESIGIAIAFLVILVVIFAVVAILIGNRYATPIKILTSGITRMSGGDFRITEEDDKRDNIILHDSTEIGSMSDAEKTLQISIRALMEKIADTLTFIASASEELTASSQQAADASSMVADSCTNVAGSCNEQMAVVGDASSDAKSFSESMDVFSETIDKFSELIKSTNKAAAEGGTSIGKAMGAMENIESSVTNTSKVVQSLGERLQTITSIVDAISDIAEQTNLLSLNASIEAARAGEAGKGFAVVADQIRKLADQSNDAANQITDLITAIQKQSDEAVSAMNEGLEMVESGTSVVEDSGAAFNDIVSMVSAISEQSDRMQSLVEEMSEGSSRINESINRIEQMSVNIADETGNVSAASEEQSASAQEIADASEKLSESAQELKNFVSRFEL